MSFRLEVLLLGLAALSAVACHGDNPRICTAAGCLPGVIVEFSEPFTTPGVYRLGVKADGRASECTLSVPATISDRCTGALDVGSFARNPMTREPLSDFAGVSVRGRHRSIAVTVQRAGRLLVHGSANPVYRGREINGPGCGTCPGAKVFLPSLAR